MDKIEEAGYEYIQMSEYRKNELEAFIVGAKSDAARDYWREGYYSEESIKELYEDIRSERNSLRDKFEESTNPPYYLSLQKDIKSLDRVLSIFEKWFNQNKKSTI